MTPALLASVDTGGTFTDVVLYDPATGAIHSWKVPSTPEDPSTAILDGLEALTGELGRGLAEIGELRHGTTVGTNALIQGRLARTALLTTRGFRDVIEIRRQQRPDTYDLTKPKPDPIAPRDLRLELAERTAADGVVRAPVEQDELAAAASGLAAAGVEAVAICFLNSYANPANERAAGAALEAALPDVFVSTSSALAPEFREYPRVSTTLVNAGLGPVMETYLRNLDRRARAAGMSRRIRVMHSNGGVMSTADAARAPAKTISSGPVAGVVGATAVAAAVGVENAVAFDMGGTSTDVCLIAGGRPLKVPEKTVEGHPIRLPTFDVQSVGGGGGSIARVDAGGFLRVGPASAGARPGPAAYGHGGTEATVTDANVVLGRLNPTHLLGGRMEMDADAAGAVIAALGDRLGLDAVAAATGVLTVLNAEMVRALRLRTVRRGVDARDFALVAFGGAGPLHAVDVAREVGFRRVIVPATPGLLCALGLLVAELRSEFSRTRYVPTEAADAEAAAGDAFAALDAQADAWLREGAGDAEGVRLRTVDMRFQGQSHELALPVAGPITVGGWIERLDQDFRDEYARRYGQRLTRPAEIIAFRVEVTVPGAGARLAGTAVGPPDAATVREVHFDGDGWLETPVLARESLAVGATLSGPVIVEQPDTTIVIPPGVEGRVAAERHLVLEVG